MEGKTATCAHLRPIGNMPQHIHLFNDEKIEKLSGKWNASICIS
jgi:hypothetical protein